MEPNWTTKPIFNPMSKVSEGLYIGNIDASEDAVALEAAGVTHIVAAAARAK
jgi:hypothetical protein